jgi:hypothetical protein
MWFKRKRWSYSGDILAIVFGDDGKKNWRTFLEPVEPNKISTI